MNHIAKLFFKLDRNIDESDFIKKLIQIAIGGQWDADAINYFQHGLKEKIKANLPSSISILDDMPKKHIKSFWYFYFDGPQPVEKIPQELEKINTLNSKVYQLMKGAHQQVLEETVNITNNLEPNLEPIIVLLRDTKFFKAYSI